jgi:hypothetical protein
MSDPMSSVKAQAAVQPASVQPRAPEPKPQVLAKDTVQLSSAAQAALLEALETPAQTAKEARGGDIQAKRLMAKQAAAKAAAEKAHKT